MAGDPWDSDEALKQEIKRAPAGSTPTEKRGNWVDRLHATTVRRRNPRLAGMETSHRSMRDLIVSGDSVSVDRLTQLPKSR